MEYINIISLIKRKIIRSLLTSKAQYLNTSLLKHAAH